MLVVVTAKHEAIMFGDAQALERFLRRGAPDNEESAQDYESGLLERVLQIINGGQQIVILFTP